MQNKFTQKSVLFEVTGRTINFTSKEESKLFAIFFLNSLKIPAPTERRRKKTQNHPSSRVLRILPPRRGEVIPTAHILMHLPLASLNKIPS